MERRVSSVVAQVIVESTGQELALTAEDPLISTGILDSLSMVSLVIALQSEFGVQLEVTDLNVENFESIRSISNLVQLRCA